MATDIRNVVASMGNNAHMQSFATDAFAIPEAVGMARITQTGDCTTPGSVTWPAAANAVGFRCFEFQDSLQTAFPIKVIMHVGTGVSSASRPAVWFGAGTALNGSGVFSGTTHTDFSGSGWTHLYSSSIPSTGTVLPSYASHGEGFFHWIFSHDSAGRACGVFIERPFLNGEPTDEGVLLWTRSGDGNVGARQFVPNGGTPVAPAASYDAVLPTTSGFPTQKGSNTSIGPGVYPIGDGDRHTRVLRYRSTDLAQLTQFTPSVAGKPLDVLTIGAAAMPRVTNSANNNGDAIAIGWE